MSNALPLPAPRIPVETRPATADDIPYMDALQKAHSRAVGFFPTGQYLGYLAMGALRVAHAPGRPSERMGYVLSRDRYQKRDELGVVYHLLVGAEHRRSLVAGALLESAFEHSAYGCRLYCCWCAQDLAANKFWEAMGFVPLAFRAGSDKKKRVHIFWQKRINRGDEATPYWYPFQTNGGAMAADRLVFPIPPGTHWTEVTATAVPTVDADGKPFVALPRPKATRAKAVAVPAGPVAPAEPEKIRIFVGGKFKWIKRPTQLHRPQFFFAPPPPPAPLAPQPAEIVTAEKPDRPRVAPAFLAATRTLRDVFLERVNAAPWMVEPAGKYDAARLPDPTAGRAALSVTSRPLSVAA